MGEFHQQKPPRELHTPDKEPSEKVLKEAGQWNHVRKEMANHIEKHEYIELADKVKDTPLDALRTSDKHAVEGIKASLKEGLKQNPVGDPDRKGINDALYKMNNLDSVTPGATPAGAKPVSSSGRLF